MNIIDLTRGKRETYSIEMKSSLLIESVLGIAALTNKNLRHTLEEGEFLKKKAFETPSKQLKKELDYVSKHNTWKALLQLLHYCQLHDLDLFESFVIGLNDEQLKFYCIPYLGMEYQQDRLGAAKGDRKSLKRLTQFVESNDFLPRYIEYISHIDSGILKNHLLTVTSSWFKEMIYEEKEAYIDLLERDVSMKKEILKQLEPEEFVKWATGGIKYVPEPSVTRVLLIPHFIYRPWNVEADYENTKVFYYPISNESIYPEDMMIPNHFLTLKLKALGDQVRLRIVKILFEKEHSLQELSLKLNMAKSSVHHHLAILKSARLITTENGVYRANKWAIDALKDDFINFLNK